MKKKNPLKLSKEEQEMLEDIELSIEKNELTSISPKERARLAQIARNTTHKNKFITIRISEKDLLKAKAKAAQLGMPYQTWISFVIHQNL